MKQINKTSWFIDGNRAIKLCDKTAFESSGTVLPKGEIREFFSASNLKLDERISTNIIFMDEECQFEIEKDKQRKSADPGVSMFWKQTKVQEYLKTIDNHKKFDRYSKANNEDININEYTHLIFTKKNNGDIKLDIVNSNKEEYLLKKEVDKSTLKYGITIPKANVENFLSNIYGNKLDRGESQNITLNIEKMAIPCKITNVDRKNTKYDAIQIRYDSNKEFKDYLMNQFGYSEEELDEDKIEGKGYIYFYKGEELNSYDLKLEFSGGIKMDKKELLKNVVQYIQNQGYNYTYEQLSNLYLSLKTKPFLILAGISGTGKSKIARLLADSLGANFNQISIKPDWNDASEILGYKNLKDQYIEGHLTKIIKQATQNKNKPYIICLDEMNLARVEYYLSDYLSIIETRKKVDQEIITDNIIEEPQITLHLPDNIYIIGTVNMDDTTFQFSRKVLDRANTIEFSDVDLENLFAENIEEETQPLNISNDFLKTTYLKTTDIENEHRNYATKINKKIIEINEILKKSQKQFAYRVRDEILFYMIENEKSKLLHEDIAFDYQIMQKILPAINGSENSIKEILIDLFNYTCNAKIINDCDDINIEEAKKYLPNAKYKKSAQKIIYMLKGYENDGYISFWC